LIGAGAQINTSAGGRVHVDEIVPLTDLSGVKAVGNELGFGTTSSWTVDAFAICANASDLPGLELKSRASAIDSSRDKSAIVSCSTGKKLLGAGGQVTGTGAVGTVMLNEIVMGSTSASARAFESSLGTSSSWLIQAYAICANSTALPFGTLEIKTRLEGGLSERVQTATAVCSPGKKVIAAGGTIVGEGGKVVIDEITPLGDRVLVVANESAIGSGTPNNWSVGAFAVCAVP
jgi:hypothetical protein